RDERKRPARLATDRLFAEIAVDHPRALAKAVLAHVPFEEREADLLRLDPDDVRPAELPRRHQEHRADAGAEIERARRVRTRLARDGRREHVVERVAMTTLPLEDPVVLGDRVRGELASGLRAQSASTNARMVSVSS